MVSENIIIVAYLEQILAAKWETVLDEVCSSPEAHIVSGRLRTVIMDSSLSQMVHYVP
jgi:hypothetical protein